MKPRLNLRMMGAFALLLSFAGLNEPAPSRSGLGGGTARADTDDTLAGRVDLSPFDQIAVQADGRLRSYGSHARTYMGYISGPRSINDQSSGFTYLDLIFRPQLYREADIVFVKNKPLCQEIIDLLEAEGLDEARAARMEKSRLIAPALLGKPAVRQLLERRSADLIRTAKFVDMIRSGLAVAQPELLNRELRLVPPPSGDRHQPWLSLTDLGRMGQADGAGGAVAEAQRALAQSWSVLVNAWRSGNAELVNEKIAAIASMLPTLNPDLYPDTRRLAMESWYFRNGSLTKVWLIYLLSVIPLLMAVIYKWPGARAAGLIIFVIAFLFQTASVAIRWYISGRWPNANMFEAVTTAAWFGGVGALIVEFLARKSALRNLFALGSAVVSMAALMAVHLLPTFLDASISNKMPALNDIWLYIHTNVIIWSYAVIGLAAVTAMLLLAYRWVIAWGDGTIPKFRLILIPIALVVLNVTGWKALMVLLVPEKYSFVSLADSLTWFGPLGLSIALVLFEALEARRRSVAPCGRRGLTRGMGIAGDSSVGDGRVELRPADYRASSGGADMLIRAGKPSPFLRAAPPTAGQVLDAATMVSMEVAFIMLWAGLVMGAIWADHSWGRPWGWDPKEVFALNTFIIFLLLVHVRLKVKDKAFWTAVLAVIGFQVMMFNWIVVNFVIVGLHSYA